VAVAFEECPRVPEFIDLPGLKVKQITMPVKVSGMQEINVTGLTSGIDIMKIIYRNKIYRQVMIRKNFRQKTQFFRRLFDY
jgi:hypothetical protein